MLGMLSHFRTPRQGMLTNTRCLDATACRRAAPESRREVVQPLGALCGSLSACSTFLHALVAQRECLPHVAERARSYFLRLHTPAH